MTMGTQTGFPTGDPLSAFSALHLLRNYNRFLLPPVSGNDLVQIYSHPCGPSVGDLPPEDHPRPPSFSFAPATGAFRPYPNYPLPLSPGLKSRSPFITTAAVYGRRPRGEKKPIPDDQKDDRYYERRKRNNQAAKKSRDARKLREDQIALRATLLEHENAILRAQLLTLREETESLRRVVLHKSSRKESEGEGEGKESPAEWGRHFEYSLKHVNKIID